MFAAGAALASFVLCWGAIYAFLGNPVADFFRDRPGDRKGHLRLTPRAGGVCIVSLFFLVLAIWEVFPDRWLIHLPPELHLTVLFSSVAILATGLPDDFSFFEISNAAKFILELIVGLEVVILLKIPLPHVQLFFFPPVPEWLVGLFSVIWIVAVANAVNIIDGVDGLAATMVIPSFITLGIIGISTGEYPLTLVCLIIVGLVMGFLLHNISPARVFLGDTGSLFLGLMLGILSLYAVSSGNRTADLIVAPLAVGVPMLDLVTAMGRRFLIKMRDGGGLRAGLAAMTVADNNHMHHRLLTFGFSHTETWIVLAFFQSTVCALAFLAMQVEWPLTGTALLYLTIPTLWLLKHLDYLRDALPWISRSDSGRVSRKHTVGVLFADPILKYSLQRHEQDMLDFDFIDEVVDPEKGYASVIVNSTSPANFSRDVRLGEELAHQLLCPAVVITGKREPDQPNSLLSLTPGRGVFYISRPLYIPLLLEEVYRVFINYDPNRASPRLLRDTRVLRAATNE